MDTNHSNGLDTSATPVFLEDDAAGPPVVPSATPVPVGGSVVHESETEVFAGTVLVVKLDGIASVAFAVASVTSATLALVATSGRAEVVLSIAMMPRELLPNTVTVVRPTVVTSSNLGGEPPPALPMWPATNLGPEPLLRSSAWDATISLPAMDMSEARWVAAKAGVAVVNSRTSRSRIDETISMLAMLPRCALES